MSHLHKQIDFLINKYQDNPYVLNRLDAFIMKQLPATLITAENLLNERNKRKQNLSTSGELFIKEFLANNNYYYLSKLEIFVFYNGVDYKIISEDDVHYKVLTLLNKNLDLQPWKYKLKISILKLIKENNLFSGIPESITIQSVLKQLYPNVMLTKNSSKHFLIAIGDSILNKKDNIYILPINLKNIIKKIEMTYYKFFGTSNILSNFKFKYHDHDYAKMRFFHTDIKNIFKLKINYLNLICVASHYSNRYGSADNYIENIEDILLSNNVFFCKNLSIDNIISNFYKAALYECKDSIIKSKDLLYIFKKYLDIHNIPSLIFHDTFKKEIKKYAHYDINSDSYYNISSNYLPIVSKFCLFWNENMIEETECNQLEIEEIIFLFQEINPNLSNMSVNLKLNLIKNHNELKEKNIIIENDKYILNYRCKLWDKSLDVESLLFQIKEIPSNNNTLYELYLFYLKQKHFKIKMSKKCFEKIARDLLGDNIQNGIINNSFWKK